MDSTIELQKQVKDNAEDIRRFVSELNCWGEEMKRKESETRAAIAKDASAPPIRNSSMKRESVDTTRAHSSAEFGGVKKRISSSDYAAWEKFDVDKACEALDDPKHETSVESEEDKLIEEKRRRDEANVEKEKGNQFVKKEKWDSAIECYSKAIKCFPGDAIFYCNRALCFLKKKDYRAAETDCTSALALDSTYVKALHRRGLARKELNQLQEAAIDLQHANEIEPNNTAISRDYQAVQAKLEQSNQRNILERVHVESEVILDDTEFILDFNVERNTVPILPAKKHRPCGSILKEPTEKKQAVSSITWPKLDDCFVVEPIFIPPHKRSKKPLQRILIQEDGNIASANTIREASLPIASLTEVSSKRSAEFNKMGETNISKCSEEHPIRPMVSEKTETVSSNQSSGPISAIVNPIPTTIPPVPKNSVQFIAGWRQINKDSKMCHHYLKQLKGDDLPKIFQDSLDGNILSQILKVLAEEFVPANEPVLSYLQGLTQVPRFHTLTLFLSRSDKDNIHLLLKHTLNLEKASADMIDLLKKEYEI